jgi:hypothetical protein
VSSIPELESTMIDSLLAALRSAGNYVEAGATAERIAALQSLTDEQFRQLDEVWWTNDQLYGGMLPSRAMRPFYERNGRAWPPPKVPDPTPSGAISAGEKLF